MADNIGTVYIPAPVIQLKNTQFIEDGVILPQILEVPCRNIHIDVGQYWAIPTKDNGIFTGWWYQPATTATGEAITAPTFDSFSVLRIRDKMTDYTWWLLATVTSFTAACNTCCGEEFTPITYSVPVVAPCQELCETIDEAGNYYVVYAAPALAAGAEYTATASVDNEEVEVPGEHASMEELLIALNAAFSGVGSPGIDVVWVNLGLTLIGTVQDGEGFGQSICLSITAGDIILYTEAYETQAGGCIKWVARF